MRESYSTDYVGVLEGVETFAGLRIPNFSTAIDKSVALTERRPTPVLTL